MSARVVNIADSPWIDVKVCSASIPLPRPCFLQYEHARSAVRILAASGNRVLGARRHADCDFPPLGAVEQEGGDLHGRLVLARPLRALGGGLAFLGLRSQLL